MHLEDQGDPVRPGACNLIQNERQRCEYIYVIYVNIMDLMVLPFCLGFIQSGVMHVANQSQSERTVK